MQYEKQDKELKRQREKAFELLSDYLSQYRRAKRRKAILEKRLKQIRDDMRHPIRAVGYSPINAPASEIGAGAASFTYRISDCELKIYDQADEVARDLLKVMDVMDYLEKSSDEREALELYYIDGYKWEAIAPKMDVSRSQVFKLRKSGFEKLLSFKRIRLLLGKYEAQKQGE